MHEGLIPQSQKSRIYLQDFFLVREGYSKEDIEKMEPDEYDYIINLVKEMKMKGISKNPFLDGI